MYQYLWDEETGGLLLTTEQSKFSKEPRPVYASECVHRSAKSARPAKLSSGSA